MKILKLIFIWIPFCFPSLVFSCVVFSPPVESLHNVRPFYRPGVSQDVLDLDAKKAYDERLASVISFQRGLGALVNSVSENRTSSSNAAECIRRNLNRWSSAGVHFLDVDKADSFQVRQSGLVASWLLASIYHAVYRIDSFSSFDAFEEPVVDWLGKIEKIVYERVLVGRVLPSGVTIRDLPSNHHVWAAVSLLIRPKFLGPSVYFDPAISRLREFIQSSRDGVWPSESLRGARSFYYHLFTISALSILYDVLGYDIFVPYIGDLSKLGDVLKSSSSFILGEDGQIASSLLVSQTYSLTDAVGLFSLVVRDAFTIEPVVRRRLFARCVNNDRYFYPFSGIRFNCKG